MSNFACSSLAALAAYRPENDPALLSLPFFTEGGWRHHYNTDGTQLIVKEQG